MSNKDFLDEIVFFVFNDSLCHDVEESVALGIRHHWVETDSDEAFKDFAVEFGSSHVERSLAIRVFHERTRVSMLQESINHEWISPEYCLVECQRLSRVDLRLPLLQDQLQDAEVRVSGVLQKLHYEVLLLQEHIAVVPLQLQKDSDRVNVRVFAR